MSSLQTQVLREAGLLTITLDGRLDGNSAPGFGLLLNEQLDQGCERVVLDLTALRFVSSAGLRELTLLARRLGRDRRAVLVGVPAIVDEVLAMSGIGPFFDRAASREEATDPRPAGATGFLRRIFSGKTTS
jgi:anti-anti-sigma factor